MKHNIQDVQHLEKIVQRLGFRGTLRELADATIIFLVDTSQKNISGIHSLVIKIRGLGFRDLSFQIPEKNLEIFACIETTSINVILGEDDDDEVWFSFLEFCGDKDNLRGVLYTGDYLCTVEGKILFLYS